MVKQGKTFVFNLKTIADQTDDGGDVGAQMLTSETISITLDVFLHTALCARGRLIYNAV